jgi:hypothetical protein
VRRAEGVPEVHVTAAAEAMLATVLTMESALASKESSWLGSPRGRS